MTPARRPIRPFAVAPTVALAIAVVVGLVGCGTVQQQPNASRVAPGTPDITPPPSTAPTTAPTPSTRPSANPITTPIPTARRYVFPVLPLSRAWFGRAHHDYPATDIFAACGDTYRTVTAGRIVSVERVDRWDPATNLGQTRGGLSVTLLGADGVRYYGSHLRSIAPLVAVGWPVALGAPLGTVGNTGSARGTGCHVHFGISPPCGSTDWFNRRGLLPPVPYLESWRAGGQLSPAAAVSTYRKTRGCPTGPLTYP